MDGTFEKGFSALDYSEAAARRTALAETTQHPLTLWPIALGIAGGLGLGLFGFVTAPVAFTVVFGGISLGSANFATRFFGGKEANFKKFLSDRHQEFEELKKHKIENLVSELERLGCKQGSDQVAQFEEKFQKFLEVLGKVVSENELTFSRFVGTVDLVYDSGIQNLERVVILLTNISDIDYDDLDRKIRRIKKQENLTDADTKILDTWQERLKLFDSGTLEVANLLASNEEALTGIDRVGVTVGNIKTSGQTSTLQEAMKELVWLIERTNVRSQAKPLDEK